MGSLVRGAAAVLALCVSGCGGAATAISPGGTTAPAVVPSSTPTVAPSSALAARPVQGAATDAGKAAAFCVDPAFRQSELDSAWRDGDRTIVCVHLHALYTPVETSQRACVSLDAAGNYADAPATAAASVAPPVASVPSVPFRRASRDGRLRFELLGGEPQPRRAVGVLREARDGRVVKQAPIEYDEHVEFLGWMGSAVVVREHVDEGPGCILTWVDPQRNWPISLVSDDPSRPLVNCYDGFLVLKPSEGTFAVVDGGGKTVTFVDEATMDAVVVDTGHEADVMHGRRLASWMEGDDVLALAYGSTDSGAVARIDLRRRKLLGAWAPGECAAAP